MSADPYPRSIDAITEYATARPCIEPCCII